MVHWSSGDYQRERNYKQHLINSKEFPDRSKFPPTNFDQSLCLSLHSESHHAAVHGDPVTNHPPGTANQGHLPEPGADHRRCRHRYPDGTVVRHGWPGQCPTGNDGILAAEHLLQEGPQGNGCPSSAVAAHPGSVGTVYVPTAMDLLRSVQRDEAPGYREYLFSYRLGNRRI